MPDVLFHDELLNFGLVTRDELRTLGLQVVEIDPQGTKRALEHFARHRALTVNDCFALALAEQKKDCILLTGDGSLRKIAAGMGIDVHGVLWVIDELEKSHLATARQLYDALCLFEEDDLVFLPKEAIQHRIRRLRRFIR